MSSQRPRPDWGSLRKEGSRRFECTNIRPPPSRRFASARRGAQGRHRAAHCCTQGGTQEQNFAREEADGYCERRRYAGMYIREEYSNTENNDRNDQYSNVLKRTVYVQRVDSLRAASSVEEGPSHNASRIRRHMEEGQAAGMAEKCRPEGPKPKRAHASTLELEIRILVVYRVDHLDCIGLTMLLFPGPMIYDQHEARRSRTTGQENVSYHSNVVWRCLRVVYKGPSSAPTSGRLIVTASHALEDRNVGSVHVPCVGCSGSQRSKLLSSSRRVVRLGIKETQKVRPPPSNRSAALDAARKGGIVPPTAALDAARKSSMIYGPPIDSGSGRADKTEAGARRNGVDAECSNIRNKFNSLRNEGSLPFECTDIRPPPNNRFAALVVARKGGIAHPTAALGAARKSGII
ncbi:hypothetical protein K438DRAFT_1782506 [Mycena galopus ATCC 62051]|nr:hypothetical protein K438DRAFT_1782506 [Mycena galopus ATCC 62051]